MIKVSSAPSTTEYTAFDILGRVTASRQTIDGNAYNFGYAYNLGDDLVTQTYPSGKVVKFGYDSSGELTQVSKVSAGGESVYANQFGYTADGQVEKLRLGNGRWETTQFNSRRQITQIGLGYSAADTGLWKTNYEYGDWEGTSLNAQKNNGNLARQTITVPTIGNATSFTAIQTYAYDPLDRLKSATETISGSQTWKHTFLFDRFGSKTYDAAATTTLGTCLPAVCNPSANTANNRLSGYAYDAAGNITIDAEGKTFSYDGENLQASVAGSNLSVQYVYDGNNKRVKSYNAVTDQTTIFVYDASGQLAAEYTINVPAPASPTISYLTEDALGSPRVITNSFGEIKARRDFLPFGDELYAGIGGRNTAQKYSSNADDTRKKFATYQRDIETGLDFAQSRYYSPMLGRFTSPDEFKGGPNELFDFEEDASENPTFYADLTNPQSLNKYQYTYNNPYKYNDPSGHCPPISSCLDKAQEVADYVGIVPVIGDAVDAGNAIVSLARGDFEGAVRRGIGIIPYVGTPISLGMKAAKVINKADKVVDAVKPTIRGLNSEKRVLKETGLTKNTKKVSSKEGDSIPDAVTKKKIVEIKDTKRVTDTRQLRIQREGAKQSKRTHEVITGSKTKVSKKVLDESSVRRRKDLGPQD